MMEKRRFAPQISPLAIGKYGGLGQFVTQCNINAAFFRSSLGMKAVCSGADQPGLEQGLGIPDMVKD
jgi:hypothetical protein